MNPWDVDEINSFQGWIFESEIPLVQKQEFDILSGENANSYIKTTYFPDTHTYTKAWETIICEN